MDLTTLPALSAYAHAVLTQTGLEPSERSRVENVMVEERVPPSGVDLYAAALGRQPITDMDGWNDLHRSFAAAEVELDAHDPREVWTFRAENSQNHLPLVDSRVNLVRIEYAGWPCRLAGVSFDQVRAQIEALASSDPNKKQVATDFLARFLDVWNGERDKRPLFATLEMEVEDILQDTSHGWAEALRDRLGLGHYSPAPGTPPVPVFLMRYPLEDIYRAHGGQGAPVVPTLLDGSLNDFFFPSPFPGPNADPNPCLGHSVNLKPIADEGDYGMGVELLHKRIEYRPEHFLRAGLIAKPVTMPLMRARRFHLPWLRLFRDRDDFGQGVLT